MFNLLVITKLILLSSFIFAQKRDDYSKKIDSLIHTELPNSKHKFDGVILISKNGKTVYSTSVGYSDRENRKKIKLNDKFAIMSISKQITSVLVLKEAEKKHIDLQAPIKKYLPNLEQPWADSVCVYQLLNHTSGIKALDKPLTSKPGKVFNYSDLSYILLGKVLEFSTKKSYAELANNLFKDLKMKNTQCYVNSMTSLIKSYEIKDNQWDVEKIKILPDDLPAFGIISTAKDINTWNQALHQGKLLQPEMYNRMISYSIKAQHIVFGEKEVGYGFGIRINDEGKVHYIGHTGAGYGFTSTNLYFPEEKVSIIILENKRHKEMKFSYFFQYELKNLILKSSLLNKF
ncbi:MAG: beta-lactamase family protein [Flavobacteriaceae bacterium]|jgi:CubicO group peptidase (beta-lactamase class C family)|nr:beta-lactamase family protein [Flavobacteriaceae bacterium]